MHLPCEQHMLLVAEYACGAWDRPPQVLPVVREGFLQLLASHPTYDA